MGTYLSAWKELWKDEADSCSKITSKGYSTDPCCTHLAMSSDTSETCSDSVPNPHLTQSRCKMKQGRAKKKLWCWGS